MNSEAVAVPAPPGTGVEGLANRRLGVERLPRFSLSIAGFSVDGDGGPPPLRWDAVPGDPHSFVLVCEDPDAPGSSPFVHWLVYAIGGHVRALEANLARFREGLNGLGERGFRAGAPSAGNGPHRYYVQLFALDVDISLPEGAEREYLLDAMAGHVIAWAELVGTYARH